MADAADISQALADTWNSSALDQHNRVSAREARRPVNGSGLCIDCAEPIAPARLAFNPRLRRCISCQTDHELRSRP